MDKLEEVKLELASVSKQLLKLKGQQDSLYAWNRRITIDQELQETKKRHDSQKDALAKLKLEREGLSKKEEMLQHEQMQLQRELKQLKSSKDGVIDLDTVNNSLTQANLNYIKLKKEGNRQNSIGSQHKGKKCKMS